MLRDPYSYVRELEGKNYAELVVIRDEIREEVRAFESDYEMKGEEWTMYPSPVSMYQWNLTVLPKIEDMIREAFRNECNGENEDMVKIYDVLKDARKKREEDEED